MNWIFLSCLPPLFYALSNVMDQYIARDYFKGSVTGFFIFSGLASAPFLIGTAILFPQVFTIPLITMFLLMMLGCLIICAIWPYILALQQDDGSIAVPIFQTIPVFVLIMSWLFLGETMSLKEMGGGFLIVLSAVAVMLDLNKKIFRLKTFLLMLLSSLLWAVIMIAWRIFAQTTDPVTIVFWEMMALLAITVAVLCLHQGLRQNTMIVMKNSRGMAYYGSFIQQTTDIGAGISMAAALAVAPSVTMVALIGGLQPFFIILFCGVAALFRPDIYDQLGFNRHLTQKIICATFLLFGLWILLSE